MFQHEVAAHRWQRLGPTFEMTVPESVVRKPAELGHPRKQITVEGTALAGRKSDSDNAQISQ